ncbi:hypothetical protein FHS49_002567 [Sphingobium boeckii]|uniref:Myb-like domain-containing protein n=2 Tax=Sphingobium boeckii TaxID=1082345 RepID=A0A7W9AIZ1_9SPHN|nr:hypothetical protein [Sphingobium boeckii]
MLNKSGRDGSGDAIAASDLQEEPIMAERFERHRQPWTSDEIQKLHRLAAKGMPLKSMAKALTRSEESIQARAKEDGLKISKLR